MAKYYPSNSAFVTHGGEVITKHKNGCLRYLQVSSRFRVQIQPDIDPVYKQIGELGELQLFYKLRAVYGDRVKREVPIKTDIEGLTFSGRMDFVIYDKKGVIEKIIEKKSVISKNSRRDYFKEPNPNHLAQLICYLVVTGTPYGALNYTYHEQTKEREIVTVEEKQYEVLITDNGEIVLDGKILLDFGASSVVKHIYEVAKWDKSDEIAPRPANAFVPFKSPCHYCPMSVTCDRFDFKEIDGSKIVEAAEFEVIERLSKEIKREVSIPIHKPKSVVGKGRKQ